MEAKGTIDDSKEGFRKRRDTGMCIYKLIDSYQHIIGQGRVAAALFIDLEKAFYSIMVDGLMYKLREAGTNSCLLNIVDDYLRNRSVYTEKGENRPESFKPKIGVPQGSILSPNLLIYIADMFKEGGCKYVEFFWSKGQRSNLLIELQGSNGMRSNFIVFIVRLGRFAPFAK